MCRPDVFRFGFATILAGLSVRSFAQTMVVLVDPAYGLDPDRPLPLIVSEKDDGPVDAEFASNILNYGRGEHALRALAGFGTDHPRIVIGKSPTEIASNRTLILQLERPQCIKRLRTTNPMHDGPGLSGAIKNFHYQDVVTIQPFSLWFHPDSSTAPILLGGAFVWQHDGQLRRDHSGHPVPWQQFLITNEQVDVLMRNALRHGVGDIPLLMKEALAQNLIVGRGTWNLTPHEAIEWADKLPHVPPADPSQIEQDANRAMQDRKLSGKMEPLYPTLPRIPSSHEIRVTFRPDRVRLNNEHECVVEVDLWNRLPIAVQGSLHRYPSKKSPETAVVRDLHLKDEPGRAYARSMNYTFRLAPGEKGVASFVIPKDVPLKTTAFREDEIAVTDVAWDDEAANAFSKKRQKQP